MTTHPLAQKWRTEADLYERDGQSGAALLRRVAQELEAYEETYDNELLTLSEAATASGYTKDHLSLLISQGKLPNAGKHGAPRLTRRSLPKKPPRAPLSLTATGGPDLVGRAHADQGILPSEP